MKLYIYMLPECPEIICQIPQMLVRVIKEGGVKMLQLFWLKVRIMTIMAVLIIHHGRGNLLRMPSFNFKLVVHHILYIPAKPLHSHDIASVHCNPFYFTHGNLRQTKKGLSYVNLHISQCG